MPPSGAEQSPLPDLELTSRAAGRIWFLLSSLLLLIACTLLTPFVVALLYGESHAEEAFAYTIFVCALAGVVGVALFHDAGGGLTRREGLAVVGIGWMLVCVAGALPYVFAGTLGFVDALFESASGFTGAGATVIPDVESVSHGVLFWRSLTHWLGGMGFVVLYIAVFPLLGIGAMQLYQAEAPGPEKDKITPRVRDTAKVLWLIYIGLTGALTLLLLAGRMGLFDALCHAFGAIATGGFSTRNASVGAFHSPYIEWVLVLFLFISSNNFALHYFVLRGRPMRLLKDPEWRFYLITATGVSLACMLLLVLQRDEPFWTALRDGAFVTVSTMSTTGYVTADYETWPHVLQFLLFVCLFAGGCAGSTAGGIKFVRILVLLRHVRRQLALVLHPHLVSPIRLSDRVLTVPVIRRVLAFIGLYLLVFIVASCGMMLVGLDLPTALSATITCMSNVGPGLADVGPTDNFAFVHPVGKLILSFCMVAGRLELYTLLLLFTPAFWRR